MVLDPSQANRRERERQRPRGGPQFAMTSPIVLAGPLLDCTDRDLRFRPPLEKAQVLTPGTRVAGTVLTSTRIAMRCTGEVGRVDPTGVAIVDLEPPLAIDG
jgi:hypothetical protein